MLPFPYFGVPVRGLGQPSTDWYYYYMPRAEKLVREYKSAGKVLAIITQTHQAMDVLSTTRAAIIDTHQPDSAEEASDLLGFDTQWTPADQLPKIQGLWKTTWLGHVCKIAAANPRLGFRIYDTSNGFRTFLTHREYWALEPEFEQVCLDLKADRKYLWLSQEQECFRARVTGKPWRMGIKEPFQDAQDPQAWIENYKIQNKKFAVCRLVASLGNPRICKTVQAIIKIHDELTIRPGAMLA